jgi:diacylglycerol kinase (ATP)
VALATWLELDALRWAVLVVSCSIVLVAEALNTGLEYACDAITTERHPMIGKAKDVAAGAVLVAALFAIIVGAILFIPLIRVKFGL